MRWRLVLLVLLVGVSWGLAERAQAQVRFSIGGNGWSVGNAPYGGYGYGGGWDGYGYGYNPYYYNRPVRNYYYYDNDDYDYVPQQVARPNPPYNGPGVSVRNPAKTEVALAYLLDDSREQSIEAGETQKLTQKGSYIITFDRGGEHGTARYTITEGLYEFTLTDHGWELYRQKETAAKPDAVKSNPLPAAPKPEVPPEPKPEDPKADGTET